MYFSITFSSVNPTTGYETKRNTWEDWRLIPTSPPMVESPEPYTNYVDIPGRKQGPIDLSEVLSGGQSYGNSEGSWEFVLDEDGYSRMETYNLLKEFLHGKKLKIYFEEDQAHYYIGRLSVPKPEPGRSNTRFTINYIIQPTKYKLDGTEDGI